MNRYKPVARDRKIAMVQHPEGEYVKFADIDNQRFNPNQVAVDGMLWAGKVTDKTVRIEGKGCIRFIDKIMADGTKAIISYGEKINRFTIIEIYSYGLSDCEFIEFKVAESLVSLMP